ncbi:TaqI family restriction endonuclease [Porifericola rhodea]|uniref:TaqI family restriction endonuclease n=1 Tax=Porifericola rhodea TaxID=930972 RepID=UPI0026667822|nr:TaqI family restriction endonuclease [Porifericola rhodea]WKN32917.1 TaqI family restriction endonuclease [Porifericola rhodea]
MLKAYLEFLASLKLDNRLRSIRCLEEDLRGELNPACLLDELFFEKKQWVDFETFYDMYLEAKLEQLQVRFQDKKQQDLLKGLKARLYRTQCGILTEYQAFLAARLVFGEQYVHRSIAQDKRGVDFSIWHQQKTYHVHIFVDSSRAWYYRQYKSEFKNVEQSAGIHINFPYALAPGKLNSLYYLPNGFGVYTPAYLHYLHTELYSGKLLKNQVCGVKEDGFIYRSIS